MYHQYFDDIHLSTSNCYAALTAFNVEYDSNHENLCLLQYSSTLCDIFGLNLEISNKSKKALQQEYGSGHGTVAVLLPGFAINW